MNRKLNLSETVNNLRKNVCSKVSRCLNFHKPKKINKEMRKVHSEIKKSKKQTQNLLRESEISMHKVCRYMSLLHDSDNPDINNFTFSKDPNLWTCFGERGVITKLMGNPEGLDRVTYNVFSCFFQKGDVLKRHKHSKHYETIILLHGSLYVHETQTTINLNNSIYTIPKGVIHTVGALENSEFIVKFEPPIPVNLADPYVDQKIKDTHEIIRYDNLENEKKLTCG